MECEGCGGALGGGRNWGGAVSPTFIHHLGQNLGDGVKCFHHPIELTSAHPKDCLLELQNQEIIAVNERSTISVLWKFTV